MKEVYKNYLIQRKRLLLLKNKLLLDRIKLNNSIRENESDITNLDKIILNDSEDLK